MVVVAAVVIGAGGWLAWALIVNGSEKMLNAREARKRRRRGW